MQPLQAKTQNPLYYGTKGVAISSTLLCPKIKLFFYLPSPLNQSQPFFFTYFLFLTNHTTSSIILTYFLNTRANLKITYILGTSQYYHSIEMSWVMKNYSLRLILRATIIFRAQF